MEIAHNGTLFLDEVNEMGLGCQAKLLRALERREFRRVGGTTKIKVNLNLLTASNVNLESWRRVAAFAPISTTAQGGHPDLRRCGRIGTAFRFSRGVSWTRSRSRPGSSRNAHARGPRSSRGVRMAGNVRELRNSWRACCCSCRSP